MKKSEREQMMDKEKKSKQFQKAKKAKTASVKKVSLRTELIVWSVGILLVFMGVQVISTRNVAQNYAIYEKEQQMAELLDRLVSSYSDEVMDIYAIVETYQEVDNIRLCILGEDLLIYHSSSVEKAPARESGMPSIYNDRSESISEESDSETSDTETSESQTSTGGRPVGGNPNNRNPVEGSETGGNHAHFTLPEMPEIPEMPEEVGKIDHMGRLDSWLNVRFPSNPQIRDELHSTMMEVIDGNMVTLEHTFDYNGEQRTILIWSSVVAIDSAVSLFVKVNMMVSAVVIFFTVFGVVLFSQRFTAPIINVEKVADAVANLDFSSTAPENVRTRELTHLAQSINLMSSTLEEMIGELNQDNQNLTDKVENQEKLEQMRRQFVANISHEMKTPLSMLMMYSESLKSDLPGMDKTFYYDTIIEEAAGLNAMVEQLLDTSAVENGLSTMDLVELNFSDFVTDFLERLSPLYGEYEVSKKVAEGICIKGDRKYLEQAVRNFVTNAIAHTEKGKEIRISLEKQEGNALFTVENQGKPIAEEDIPFLWDSFYRGDKSRTQMTESKEKRVGLGLYIVKTCISSHFGTVKAENRREFVAFSFEIPLAE